MNTALKSKIFAIALTLGAASTITLAQSIAAPTPAQAGVVGSIKGAAKSVGGAVKNTAKGIGGATKAGAAGVRQAGRAVAKYVPPVKGIVNAGKAIKVVVRGK
jgi:hypothetical protein